MSNEHSSPRAAKIAGQVLKRIQSQGTYRKKDDLLWAHPVNKAGPDYPVCTIGEIEVLAGSVLTQAKDKESNDE